MCIDMGERLASIQTLLSCPNAHSDAEIIEQIRKIVALPNADLLEEMRASTQALARDVITGVDGD